MRGFAAASAPPERRRWKGPAVAVLSLVVVVFSLARLPSRHPQPLPLGKIRIMTLPILVTRNIIFHIATDTQNYYAMKVWFARHSFEEATIHVINLEEPNLQNLNDGLVQLSLSEEFRVSIHKKDQPAVHIRTEYISVFGHSHFLPSDIFRSLKKVVVLDDDVVVQHDPSPLWCLNMEGKVNGAMEFCGVNWDSCNHIWAKITIMQLLVSGCLD
ncbi:hypothetical protein OPV22_006710 [Ensete ventricosum]|uniref:Hexosyltransferase n=1 Tax=Ensete ventricosum TaxID=4639 RepID=A0AAV8RNN7_ENSVE|nr:hypothetical protein OPV22_006710 [Ensete ventricosum]